MGSGFSGGSSTPPTDANLTTSDITTNDASGSKHGFGPKGSGTATNYWGGDWAEHAITAKSATAVVVGSGGDYTTLSAALSALTGDAEIYVREGTYNISATHTLPAYNIKIRGAGNGTIFALGANAISLFTMNQAKKYIFSDFTVTGDSSHTQKIWLCASGMTLGFSVNQPIVTNVTSSGVMGPILDYAGINCGFTMSDCLFDLPNSASALFITSTGTYNGTTHLKNVTAHDITGGQTKGGITGNPVIFAEDCSFGTGITGGNAISIAVCKNVNWRGTGAIKITSLAGFRGGMYACDFGAQTITYDVGDNFTFTGCDFESSTVTQTATTATGLSIIGGKFQQTTFNSNASGFKIVGTSSSVDQGTASVVNINAGCADWLISGVSFRASNTPTNYIVVAATAAGGMITNCVFGQTTGATITTACTSGIVVYGCSFSVSTTTCIAETGSAVGTIITACTQAQKQIDANKLTIVAGSGLQLDGKFPSYITTTDATQTTLQTIAIAASTSYYVDVEVVARRTGGSGGTADDGAIYKRRALVTTKTGTVTINTIETIGTDQEDQAAWDVTLTVSSTNILVRVTGAANNNISWRCNTELQKIGS